MVPTARAAALSGALRPGGEGCCPGERWGEAAGAGRNESELTGSWRQEFECDSLTPDWLMYQKHIANGASLRRSASSRPTWTAVLSGPP